MAPAKPKVNVEIVSDTVCPWCYLGKKRLERALDNYGDKLDVEVKWLPFMLNPDASKEGINKEAYYREKFGSARTDQMVPQMTALYANEGLKYSLGGKTGNTLNSHRLLTRAYEEGGAAMQDALAEKLMKGYFTEEKFINDPDFLAEAAESVGMKNAREFLADPKAGLNEVRSELHKYPGISGVPHFVINGKLHLSGAQPPEAFEELFNEVLQGQQQ